MVGEILSICPNMMHIHFVSIIAASKQMEKFPKEWCVGTSIKKGMSQEFADEEIETLPVEREQLSVEEEIAEAINKKMASKPAVPTTSQHRNSPSDTCKSRSLTPAGCSSIASDEGTGSRPGSGKLRQKSHSPTLSSIRFFSGNPIVETTEGIMHLYKEK
jgi:hypothetical protein